MAKYRLVSDGFSKLVIGITSFFALATLGGGFVMSLVKDDWGYMQDGVIGFLIMLLCIVGAVCFGTGADLWNRQRKREDRLEACIAFLLAVIAVLLIIILERYY